MKDTYECWIEKDGVGLTFGTRTQIAEYREKGLLGDEPMLLYIVEAETPEEAKAVHHVRMGWEPYLPQGSAEKCPRGCGAMYYPESSGVCRNCGQIS